MSDSSSEINILDTPYEGFATSLLDLYGGPTVVVRVGSAGRQYRLSKALICKQSPYFAAAFEGEFKEEKEQSTTLEEVEDVVSVRSFELLVQWMYLGRVVLGDLIPEEAITAVIEFLRLADMCSVIGMERQMVEHIKAIILKNSDKDHYGSATGCITTKHIVSASCLPDGHLLRNLFATASIEGYFRRGEFKFEKEAEEVLGFAGDLHTAVRATIKTIKRNYNNSYIIEFKDPLREEYLSLT